MASVLPSGLYTIKNVGHGQWAGHDLTLPTIKPIIGTDHLAVWVVEHIEGERYRLTLNGFVTKPEGNVVFSYLGAGIVGTEWVLVQSEEKANKYFISDPAFLPGFNVNVWTLKEKNARVNNIWRALQHDPNQLWVIDHFVEREA
ncbi:hypothetical protein F5148DRAFT_1367715 [Russula earlei]|uniref:Uncharacterized protein n=1 Tax=Russula earlei TaxID=71964 RepID=A0ACC0UAT4_9AGAM|nr:hypothetical protein F5148DRAFT_1367715 [Russula earlei]